ncbi:MAG TPA: permease-like cell division protein FtsX [Candidatus Saccharimonadales bacterium]|nr:permease-like cell division protein FtsX [Candidatus Saccharimonadales bacterium]
MIKQKAKDVRVKLAQNKKLHRRFLTWLRMARYGANNFTRNAWLSTAATAVMTITLIIIFTTVAATSILSSTVNDIKQKVDISIYMKNSVSQAQVDQMSDKLRQDENVRSVDYIDLSEARDIYIRENDPSEAQLKLISQYSPEKSPFPPSLSVGLKDPTDFSSIQHLVETDEDFKSAVNPDRPPSYTGKNRKIIDTIGGWVNNAQKGGLALSIVFVAISMLIIFNTIRMAIFNRKDEIQMMKLIGADRKFIRGPFVVEAVMYGFVAALAATVLGFLGLVQLQPVLAERGVAIDDTKNLFTTWWPLILLAMIIIGAIIGMISSRLAVRRYLRV